MTDGTTTFTSSAGNFQAGHVGEILRIGTKGAFKITAVGSATSVTLDGSPSAGTGLTYSIAPHSAIEIASVDSNTQITLVKAWPYGSQTGGGYQTWRDIKLIGDEDGRLTDGIGGQVRITGSDNDQTATRANGITCANSFWTFRGLHIDTTTTNAFNITGGNCIVEQCATDGNAGSNILFSGASAVACTARRNDISVSLSSAGIRFVHTATVDNTNNIAENNRIVGMFQGDGVAILKMGGVIVSNNLLNACNNGVRIPAGQSPASGQVNALQNNIICSCLVGLTAPAAADMVEDYNNLFLNSTNRTNTAVGSHSQVYTPLFNQPLLTLGMNTVIQGVLDASSLLASIAGRGVPDVDMYGTTRVATSSWGPIQYIAGQRPVDSGEPRGRRGS